LSGEAGVGVEGIEAVSVSGYASGAHGGSASGAEARVSTFGRCVLLASPARGLAFPWASRRGSLAEGYESYAAACRCRIVSLVSHVVISGGDGLVEEVGEVDLRRTDVYESRVVGVFWCPSVGAAGDAEALVRLACTSWSIVSRLGRLIGAILVEVSRFLAPAAVT